MEFSDVFLTDIKIWVTANIIEKIISGMLAVITPEKMNISDGSMESNNDFKIPSLFQSIIQIMQYAVTSAEFTTI